MRILKDRAIPNDKVPAHRCDHAKGWFSGEAFVDILNRERNRSDRSGLPLSLVLIDLSSLRNGNGRPDVVHHAVLDQITDAITENTRISDVKYVDTRDRIGILLLDTGLEGTKSYVRKMSAKLHEHLGGNGMSGRVDWMRSIDVKVIPVRSAPGYVGLEESKSAAGLGRSRRGRAQPEERDGTDEDSPDVSLNWRTVQPHEIVGEDIPGILKEGYWSHDRSAAHRVAKRTIDILGSIAGIILCLPVMAIVALLIRLTSGGPVLFRQERLGYLSRRFTFLKFRTMRTDCDDRVHREYVEKLIEGREDEVNRGTREEPLFKLDDDKRVTPVGRFLRKASLDELPQFFNVLMGSMSLVGPRPPIPYETEKYQGWHWRRVMEAKPGITGLWQVYGRSRTTHAEMVRLDLRYIRNQSLWLDLKIILKTFIAVFDTRGAL